MVSSVSCQLICFSNTTCNLSPIKTRRLYSYPCPGERCLLSVDEKLIIFAYCILLVVGVCGNSIAIYVYHFKIKYLSKPNMLVSYLAVFDLLSSIYVPAMKYYRLFTYNMSWNFGNISCKLLSQLEVVTVHITNAILLLFVIDRCLAICRPFSAQISKNKMKYILLLFTVLILLGNSPFVLSWKLHNIAGYRICCRNSDQTKSFGTTYILIIGLKNAILIISFAVCNYLIYKTFRKQGKDRRWKNKKSLGNKRKAIKILGVSTIVFFVLTIPYDIFNVMRFIFTLDIEEYSAVSEILIWLQYSNSMVNVFIYAKLNPRFLQKIFK